ncbi:unnamed protein product, partial [Ectocarpus sp. 12 AP-2014]
LRLAGLSRRAGATRTAVAAAVVTAVVRVCGTSSLDAVASRCTEVDRAVAVVDVETDTSSRAAAIDPSSPVSAPAPVSASFSRDDPSPPPSSSSSPFTSCWLPAHPSPSPPSSSPPPPPPTSSRQSFSCPSESVTSAAVSPPSSQLPL